MDTKAVRLRQMEYRADCLMYTLTPVGLQSMLTHIVQYIWRWDNLVKDVEITQAAATAWGWGPEESERWVWVPCFQLGLNFLTSPVLAKVAELPQGMVMKAKAETCPFEYPVLLVSEGA